MFRSCINSFVSERLLGDSDIFFGELGADEAPEVVGLLPPALCDPCEDLRDRLFAGALPGAFCTVARSTDRPEVRRPIRSAVAECDHVIQGCGRHALAYPTGAAVEVEARERLVKCVLAGRSGLAGAPLFHCDNVGRILR